MSKGHFNGNEKLGFGGGYSSRDAQNFYFCNNHHPNFTFYIGSNSHLPPHARFPAGTVFHGNHQGAQNGVMEMDRNTWLQTWLSRSGGYMSGSSSSSALEMSCPGGNTTSGSGYGSINFGNLITVNTSPVNDLHQQSTVIVPSPGPGSTIPFQYYEPENSFHHLAQRSPAASFNHQNCSRGSGSPFVAPAPVFRMPPASPRSTSSASNPFFRSITSPSGSSISSSTATSDTTYHCPSSFSQRTSDISSSYWNSSDESISSMSSRDTTVLSDVSYSSGSSSSPSYSSSASYKK